MAGANVFETWHAHLFLVCWACNVVSNARKKDAKWLAMSQAEKVTRKHRQE